MISPEDSPGCQGLHYIFNYKDIHMVTLQYVQLLNMHPGPAAMLEGLVICWKIPSWDMGLLLGSHTDCGMGVALRVFSTGKFLAIETQILVGFLRPPGFNNLLSCEGEFKSALQTSSGLKSSSDMGKSLDKAKRAQPMDFPGADEGSEPISCSLVGFVAATVTSFAPHRRHPEEGQSCRVRSCHGHTARGSSVALVFFHTRAGPAHTGRAGAVEAA